MLTARIRLLLLLGVFLPGCGRGAAPVAAPEKPKVEADLAFVTLAKKEVASLRIESRPVVTKRVQEHLPLTGWIMARQGREVTLTSPVSGYVRGPRNGNQLPSAGKPVQATHELYALEPVLSPVERIQMAALRRSVLGDLTKAKASVSLAELELKIVTELFEQEIKKEQEVKQAKVRLMHAQEDLITAKDKLKHFEQELLPIRAPQSGTVLGVHVSPGQYVMAGAPLVSIIDLSTLWVRVPVPERSLLEVNLSRPTTVGLRSATDNGLAKRANSWQNLHAAQPIAAVPQVDVARHTADLIYEMSPYPWASHVRQIAAAISDVTLPPLARSILHPPRRPAFAKDQMVTVFVPIGRERTASVVPYSAIVYDAHGGAWIYVERTDAKEDKHRYQRRRVELSFPVAEGVVIRPVAGADERVVTLGAGILFSREFYHTGVKLADLDDD